MNDPRRHLGTFAVIALVLLRLVTGWHFFHEGTQKVTYDRGEGRWRITFSADGFLSQAKGPLAGVYHLQTSGAGHDWQTLLATPQQNVRLSDAEAAERARWRPAEPTDFPPHAPYLDWVERIAADWRETLARVTAIEDLSDEQREAMAEAYLARVKQLSEYLADNSEAITEYRHELWRLESWRAAPEADEVPFYEQRIATKAAQTGGQPGAWVAAVRALERGFHDDLRALVTPEQKAEAESAEALRAAMTPDRQQRMNWINVAVTGLTIGVGVCLLLGLFTRLASIAGALFLLSVVASQPPWVTGAAPIHYQCVELAGLLVLAGTGAGRWAGLDYFLYALFNRRRDEDVS